MLKQILFGIFATILSPLTAEACSCFCNYDHKVSEYLKTHKVFWGVPKKSQLTSDYTVISEVEVLEGYKRIISGETIKIESQPEDGASCGIQLYTGVPQFIIAKKAGKRNISSTCNCEPPSAYLIEYLKNDKDTYLPSLNDCWGNDDEIKSNLECKAWRDVFNDDTAEFKERMRMHQIMRENRSSKIRKHK